MGNDIAPFPRITLFAIITKDYAKDTENRLLTIIFTRLERNKSRKQEKSSIFDK